METMLKKEVKPWLLKMTGMTTEAALTMAYYNFPDLQTTNDVRKAEILNFLQVMQGTYQNIMSPIKLGICEYKMWLLKTSYFCLI